MRSISALNLRAADDVSPSSMNGDGGGLLRDPLGLPGPGLVPLSK